ncbi:Fe-S cluster assembly transcriptional regulator IscR [Pleionea mediterranea]|uniref:BadM/Rrf2 family transcriptional regulator n=1 Tax=Pleionea mediterranea TaxID=523701 RepID=A0A316FP74_9GAMM|nr:Fe-S cluster assembly transcriptional regulator IscR [Pleionea mediterranea]PWK50005.1 BadM/Rrf2 family transcriptional regulator [Pleionea mediterranea]
MKLTTKGRYAVTAMLDLAIHAKDKPVTLQDISGRQGISLSYLEQLFAKLRRNELVKSSRGPGGGYQLQEPASDIAISRVIDAVNESTDVTACGSKGNCHNGQQCITHDLWCELSEQIHSFLSSITLQTVINKQQAKEQVELLDNREQNNTFILSQVS